MGSNMMMMTMNSLFIIAAVVFVTLVQGAKSHNEDVSSLEKERTNDDVKQCSIWMAPSSLIGHTGFGLYTTRDINEDEAILSAPDGPSIPVFDFTEGPPSQKEVREEWIKFFDDYWWGSPPDHVNYEAGDDTLDFQITHGSLLNHHCILSTVDHRYPETAYDDSMIDRFKDPGAGAFSYHMGREFYVKKEVKAGDELFLSYGHCTRDQDTLDEWEWTAYIPMTEDYIRAARIAWKYLIWSNDTDMEITAPEYTNEFVAALLPKSTSHLRSIVASADDKIMSPRDLVPLIAKHMTTTPRTPEWIRSNGMCIENLVPRKSTLPHAGQGAFAQHFIGKGEIVVPAPLLHIVDKDVLMIHSDNSDTNAKSDPKWQLLLNYCSGHDESSLLLCPNTNAILINHCSDRKKQCGPDGPNAEYRWSTGWDPMTDEFRNMTIDEISKQSGRGLSMEVVALRDINPGEEVFMDYSAVWEEAWEAHVANWKPPANAFQSFVTAKEANEQKGPLELHVTGDVRKTYKHSHLFTGCLFHPTKADRRKVWDEEYVAWPDLDDAKILALFADDGSMYKGDYQNHNDHDYWPCSVIARDESDTYTVRIHQHRFLPQVAWDANDLPRFLTNYPRQSIRYFVKPYASDQNLPFAFRHPIHIRDDIFPEQWKNLVQL